MSPVDTMTSQAPMEAATVQQRSEDVVTADHAISLERLGEAFGMVHRLCLELPVLAIRWLHLNHPLHPMQEALLRGEAWREKSSSLRKGACSAWLAFLHDALRCVLYAAWLSGRLLAIRMRLRHVIAALNRRPFTMIARTWAYADEPPRNGRDFYYGDLQERLVLRGIPMLLLCGDVLDGPWRAFAATQVDVKTQSSRLPELCLIHPLAPWRMVVKQLASASRLRRFIARTQDPMVRAILRLASRACLDPDTALMGLTSVAAKSAVRRWSPQAFLTLYEGHAYERCVCLGVKAADPDCRTIGYQHSILFQESLSLTSAAVETHPGSRPDVILSLGRIPQEMLQVGHDLTTHVILFGSFRFQPALVEQPVDPRLRTVLVTPQGTLSEVRALFEFAAQCAQRLPAYAFVFRCHPQLSLREALRLLPKALRAQPNIRMSEGLPIEADFITASVLLYRGSSTVLYGVLCGVLPVYLHLAGQPDRDPVYALKVWRRRCRAVEDFTALMAAHEQMSPDRLRAEWVAAAQYVKAYVQPVEEAAIDALIEAMGQKGNLKRLRREGQG